MRFHVLGIGSIGTLVAHHLRLAQPTADVCLVVRNADAFHKRKYLRDGPSPRPGPALTVAQNGGETVTSEGYELDVSNPAKAPGLAAAVAAGSVDVVNAGGPIESLIVCTKTPATEGAIAGLRSRISPSSVIALLQNGMGVYDELCAKFWPEPNTRPHFILGTTTHGVTRTSEAGSVLHMSRPGQGAIKWGVINDPRERVDMEAWLWGRHVGDLPALTPPLSPALPLPRPPSADVANVYATLEALLSMSPLSPTLLPMPHLYHELLLKLAINATINPLTAVLGGGYLRNGALHRSSPGHRLVQQTVGETSAVLTAYLHNLAGAHPAAPDTLRLFSRESILQRVHDVIAATRDNTSSMAMDVKSGRVTEIDYINGFLVSLGHRLGVPAPVHQMLVQMVKFKAEVGGLNQKLYPAVEAGVRRGEENALELRRLGLEERRLALDERAMLLREGSAAEIKRSLRRNRKMAQHRRRALGESGGGSEKGGLSSSESSERESPAVTKTATEAETSGARGNASQETPQESRRQSETNEDAGRADAAPADTVAATVTGAPPNTSTRTNTSTP